MKHTKTRAEEDDVGLPTLLPMIQVSNKFPSILLNGIVNDVMVHNFHNFYRELRELGHQRAIIYIDSPGGEVHALNAICNIMDTSAIEWHTVCLGAACSCGLLLLANGDVRYVSDRSVILFHDVSAGIFGKLEEMSESLTQVRKTSSIVLKMFADKTNKPLDWWIKQTKKLETRDFWFDAKEAIEYGVADYYGIPSWGVQPPAQGIIMIDKRAPSDDNPNKHSVERVEIDLETGEPLPPKPKVKPKGKPKAKPKKKLAAKTPKK